MSVCNGISSSTAMETYIGSRTIIRGFSIIRQYDNRPISERSLVVRDPSFDEYAYRSIIQ